MLYAIDKGSGYDAVKYLSRNFNVKVEVEYNNGYSALHMCCSQKYSDLQMKYVKMTEAKDCIGHTPARFDCDC